MNKYFGFSLFLISLFLCMSIQGQENYHRLSGFQNSPYFDEQVLSINYPNEIKIQINAPSSETFNPEKPVSIALFALPNGNTTDQTIGKITTPSDDWHYNIQHIGAQTRFLRNHVIENNLVTVYLENDQRSWPSWKAKYTNHDEIIKELVDYIRNIFSDYESSVVLTGHSGGGRFSFSFMDAYTEIPAFVKRISFLDSNYGYEHTYGTKMINWLKSSEDNYLSVIAYNDSVALYNGQPIVSATGGTWYRSRMMKKFMESDFEFTNYEDSEFIKHEAANGRIKIFLKKNPERKILHTVQVELNGFIQGMVSGTSYESVDYEYYGDRAYSELIQRTVSSPAQLKIPPRPSDAVSGSQFMASVYSFSIEAREAKVLEEISKGNIPNFLRSLTKIESAFLDVNGVSHSVIYEVMPDYLAIGSDEDFCRIPMGPITAQKIADLFGAAMPTSKLVDNIYTNCDIKLEPVTYLWSEQSILVSKFVEHNNDIEVQCSGAGGVLGQLVGGTKKDVILSNKITDPDKTHHVVIYGWHKLDGSHWQPIYNGHIDTYMDYSHGIRLLNSQLLIDSVVTDYRDILTDGIMYKMLSDEAGVMTQPSYLKVSGFPEKPKSFGIINNGSDKLKIIIKDDAFVEQYKVYLSMDGVNYNDPIIVNHDNMIISELSEDSIYYIKLKAVNQVGDSPYSEVLSGVPSSNIDMEILIVNGFDRASTGNTYSFVRQHASAFYSNGMFSNSATNDAVLDGLFNLNDYFIVDYILGEESTADETFNSNEQSIVSDYLNNGGKLFVSGAEIAWDLDNKGSTTDKSFIWNYLKMEYADDAPFGQSGTYYNVHLVPNDFISDLSQFSFDNGTNGTYNVKYPDVVYPNDNAIGFIQYSALNIQNGFAGILYEGLFPNGLTPGKVLTLGFPFETIYPETIRNEFMSETLIFFYSISDIEENKSSNIVLEYNLAQNYPNPFNPSTVIGYEIIATRYVSLKVFNSLGQEVATLVNKEQNAGSYKVEFNASNLPSGIYIYSIKTDGFFSVKKMMLIK